MPIPEWIEKWIEKVDDPVIDITYVTVDIGDVSTEDIGNEVFVYDDES